MKKITLSVIFLCLLSLIFIPLIAQALTIVPQTCGQPGEIKFVGGTCMSGNRCPCGIKEFFVMLANIYSFLVFYIASPVAVIALIIGGALITLSAGNPALAGKGKTIVYSSLIGLALVFGAYLIINVVLTAVGYTEIGSWMHPFS